ncbi:hypothetical protein FOMPIDRAFT_1024042 [Fomitopsis schrenkii]|uniref:Uncharacterized protein n=1 Tax=Fomitopsis schrenkii TaxID=2126942 RepID=S8E4U2_FOMSC|nr:hypothetical protein FOMPIDRAFT_1024042 [Fomitopsis schrenkii]
MVEEPAVTVDVMHCCVSKLSQQLEVASSSSRRRHPRTHYPAPASPISAYETAGRRGSTTSFVAHDSKAEPPDPVHLPRTCTGGCLIA